jgi:phospholipid/cholesterol/gamma-HCH transport system substrate-binding protein
MEIRARYFLVGLFVLVVAASVFGFFYWLYNTGGLGQRTAYRVSFNGSVAGLAPGSPVLFNGLQVGEVTGLSLSAADPSQVIAGISIDARTPVRTDTHVGMDFRGLTGTATVALTGGTATAAPPTSEDGQPPLLVADPKSIQDMSNAAREALGQLNQILADNATPLKDAIANIDTFSGALAKNSDKVDAIVSGLEKFVGGGAKPEPVSFELTAPSKFPDLGTLPTSQLTVPSPTTVVALDTQRIMLRTQQGLVAAFDGYRWADSIPLIVQSRLIQGFENAGDNSVGTDSSGINGDFQLLVNIRKFELATTGSAAAEVALMAKLVDSGGSVVDAKLFEASVPASGIDKPEAVANATNAAFGKASTDLVAWALGVMSDQEGNGGSDTGASQTDGKADQNKAAPAPEPKPAANKQPPANTPPAPAKPPAKAPAPAQ